jgi:hypothetical protein
LKLYTGYDTGRYLFNKTIGFLYLTESDEARRCPNYFRCFI